MVTVLDKHIAAYRKMPSRRNRAKLSWMLCKYVACIRHLSDDQRAFLKVHDFY